MEASGAHLRLDLLLDLRTRPGGVLVELLPVVWGLSAPRAIGRIVSYRPDEILQGNEGVSCRGDGVKVQGSVRT